MSWWEWAIGCGLNVLVISAGVLWSRGASGARRSAILGATTGCAFGLTAALMRGMTNTFLHGFVALLTSWQLWAMRAAGACAMFLLRSAMRAGRLLSTQPGLTMADPVVAILWGTLVFQESVRGGLFIVLAVVAAAAAAAAVLVLSRSPLLGGDAGQHEEDDSPSGEGRSEAPQTRGG